MARQAKQSQFFTVRSVEGQFLGCYRAMTPDQAINQLIQDQYRTASTFRRSQPTIKLDRAKLVAKVE